MKIILLDWLRSINRYQQNAINIKRRKYVLTDCESWIWTEWEEVYRVRKHIKFYY